MFVFVYNVFVFVVYKAKKGDYNNLKYTKEGVGYAFFGRIPASRRLGFC